MRNPCLLIFVLFLSSVCYSIEYTFVKGDTLWDLSISYLKDPYKWPEIKNLDGSSVANVRKIPIGHKVIIPNEIVKETILALSESEISAGENDVISLDDTDHETLIKNPYHYIYIYNLSGLVRAYLDDRHVMLPAKLLLSKIKESNPGLKIKDLGSGIAISKDLVRKLLNIKNNGANKQ